MQITDLETPCLIADRARIQVNARRMQDRARRFGVALRPHVKSTKSAAIATIALGGTQGPVTVSTLKEAEYFFAHGFTDLTYAVCLTPNKFEHVASLVDRGAKLKVLLESSAIARALSAFTHGRRTPIGVMIEIDSGDHRTGLVPEDENLIAVARELINADGVSFEGLLTHAGHSYSARDVARVVAIAEEERKSLVDAQSRLMQAGIAAHTLSSGSTPTAMCGENYAGLQELRPGIYLIGDLFQAALGSCAMSDIAVSVLACVIAHAPQRNELVVDAGALALSKDRSTQAMAVDYGYGLLVQVDGRPFETDLVVRNVSQEHGQVTANSPLPYDLLPVGSLVRILPNHGCLTAASYDRYHVVDGPELTVVGEWDKATGW